MKIEENKMRLVLLSDTHTFHDQVIVDESYKVVNSPRVVSIMTERNIVEENS